MAPKNRRKKHEGSIIEDMKFLKDSIVNAPGNIGWAIKEFHKSITGTDFPRKRRRKPAK